jgi:hypothetical protein
MVRKQVMMIALKGEHLTTVIQALPIFSARI